MYLDVLLSIPRHFNSSDVELATSPTYQEGGTGAETLQARSQLKLTSGIVDVGAGTHTAMSFSID